MDPFWDQFETIERLYISEGRKAKEVKHILETQCGFPTYKLKEFTKKLGELPLRKNLKRDDWALISRSLRARGPSKRTGVYINGILEPWEKVSKEIRRMSKKRATISGTELPFRVVVRTPSPFPETTIVVNSHNILYPDVSACKQLERALILQMTSKSAYQQLDAALESGLLPWGQFEILLSRLVIPEAATASFASGKSLSVFQDLLRNPLHHEPGPTGEDLFTRLSVPSNDFRIRFSLEQLAYPPIFAELVGRGIKSSLQYAETPVADIRFLIRSIYQLANNSILVYTPADASKVLNSIFNHTRTPFMRQLLMIDSPIALMAWTRLVGLSLEAEDQTSFQLLLKIAEEMQTIDGTSIYHSYRNILFVEGWHDVKKTLLQGRIGSKLRQHLLTLNRPFFDDSQEFMKSCLDGVIPIDSDKTWLIGEFIRSILEGELPRDRGCEECQSEFANALFRHGSLRCSPYDTVEVIRAVAGLYPWLYIAFVETGALDVKYPTIACLLAILEADPAGFLENIYSTGPWCRTDRELVLQLLLSELIWRDARPPAALDLIETLLVAGANPDCHPYHQSQLTQLEMFFSTNAKDSIQPAEFIDQLIRLLIRHGATVNTRTLFAARHNYNALAMLPVIQSISLEDLQRLGACAFVAAAAAYDYEALNLLSESGLDVKDLRPWQDRNGRYIPSGFLGSAVSLCCCKPDNSKRVVRMTRYLLNMAKPSQRDPVPCEILLSVLQSVVHPDYLSVPSFDDDPQIIQKCEVLQEYGLDLTLALPKMEFGPSLRDASGDCEREFRFFLAKGMPLTAGFLVNLLLYSGNKGVILEAIEKCTELNPLLHEKLQHTPLQAAALTCNIDIVRRLVELGAAVNADAYPIRGRTALQEACRAAERTGQFAIIQFLVEKGAWVNVKPADTSELTALSWACASSGLEVPKIVEYLIGQGADIEGNGCDCTPLLSAIESGDIRLVALLLEHGASVNRCWPYHGSTQGDLRILDAAAFVGKLDIVQLLLSQGALSIEPGITGYDGAIRQAERRGYGAVAQVIRNHIRATSQD